MWSFKSIRIGHLVEKNGRMYQITYKDYLEYIDINHQDNIYNPIRLTEDLVISFGFKKMFNKQYKSTYYKKKTIRLVEDKTFNNFYCSNLPFYLPISYLHELQDFFIINTELTLDDSFETKEFVAANKNKIYGTRYLIKFSDQ